MTTVTYQGIQFTEQMLQEEKTSDLLKTYNRIAEANDEKVVNKFADHATAVKRTWAMLQKHGKSVKKEVKVATERRLRTKHFNYVAVGAPKPRRESSADNPVLRDMLLTRLLSPEGLSFNQAKDVVAEFDELRERLGKPVRNGGEHTVETRAYEGLRLIHYYLNYSLKQDGEGDDAPIRIVGNRKS